MFHLFKKKKIEPRIYATSADSLKKYHIAIDNNTISMFPSNIWKYIYNGFYKWGNCLTVSYNLIKKISYIKNSEYNIIIKWLPDMSGIELLLNYKLYQNFDEEEYKELTRIVRRIMYMAQEKSTIKTEIIDNYEHYIACWNYPFVIDRRNSKVYDENNENSRLHAEKSSYFDKQLYEEKKVLRCYLKRIKLWEDESQTLYMYVSTYPDGTLFDGEEERIQKETELLKNGKSQNVYRLKVERISDLSQINVEEWKKDTPQCFMTREYLKGHNTEDY